MNWIWRKQSSPFRKNTCIVFTVNWTTRKSKLHRRNNRKNYIVWIKALEWYKLHDCVFSIAKCWRNTVLHCILQTTLKISFSNLNRLNKLVCYVGELCWWLLTCIASQMIFEYTYFRKNTFQTTDFLSHSMHVCYYSILISIPYICAYKCSKRQIITLFCSINYNPCAKGL